MNKPAVLVVDDAPEIRAFYEAQLVAHGFDVRTAASGEEALRRIAHQPPDLVILDLLLPGLNGFQVCERLREHSSVPIIVVSARREDRDKVQALDLGADDYLVKPFSTDELMARIRAVLRRISALKAKPVPSPAVLRAGRLQIDFVRESVTLNGAPVRLTPTEYSLLRELAVNAGRLLSHSALLRLVWGPEYRKEVDYLRVFIRRLRTKLEPDPEHPRYILTKPGVGYLFEPNPEQLSAP